MNMVSAMILWAAYEAAHQGSFPAQVIADRYLFDAWYNAIWGEEKEASRLRPMRGVT